MLNEKQRKIIDEMSREIVAEYVRNSRHKNNKELLNYVYEDMPYDKVVLAAWCQEIVLQEEATESDIKRELRLKSVERQLGGLLSLPLSVIVGGPVRSAAQKAMIKRAMAQGGTAAAKAAAGAAGTSLAVSAAGIGAGIAISFGVGLLTKVIFAMIQRRFSACRKQCDGQIPDDDVLKKHKMRVCYHKCRMAQINKLLPVLATERRKCKDTDRPDRCMKGLYDQEVKYRDMLEKEKEKLMRAQENYKRAEMRLKQKMSSNKSPRMTNITRTT